MAAAARAAAVSMTFPWAAAAGGAAALAGEWAPPTKLVAKLFFIVAWCLRMRIRYSHQLNVVSKTALDVSWFLVLMAGLIPVVLLASNTLQVFAQSHDLECPNAD